MGSRGPTLTAVVILSLVLTNVTVLLRFYTRFFILRKVAFDDYVVAFCQINFIAFMVCILEEVQYGISDHLMDILARQNNDLVIAMKFQSLLESAFNFGKSSNVLQYITLNGKYFDPYKSFALLETFTVMDIMGDASLAVLPIMMVWNMKLSTPKKIAVCVLLGMGVPSTISPFIRLFYLKDLTYKTEVFTHSSWGVIFTAVTEPAIAITAVYLAQLRPLIRKVVPKSWQTAQAEHSPHSPNDKPHDPEHPATFGAGEPRPKRRSFGMSLLESTFGRSHNRTGAGVTRHGDVEATSPDDRDVSSEDVIEVEKKQPVHREYA